MTEILFVKGIAKRTHIWNWNNGMLESWPPARRACASERMMGLKKPVFKTHRISLIFLF